MEIGDYVRTKYGIAKFIDYEIKSLEMIVIDKYIAYDHDTGYRNIITSDEIINSDPDIKKLILTGDYVEYKQGKYISDQYYIVNACYNRDGNFKYITVDNKPLDTIDIVSVITFNQMLNSAYKLKVRYKNE